MSPSPDPDIDSLDEDTVTEITHYLHAVKNEASGPLPKNRAIEFVETKTDHDFATVETVVESSHVDTSSGNVTSVIPVGDKPDDLAAMADTDLSDVSGYTESPDDTSDSTTVADDLTKLPDIGDNREELFNEAGYTTYIDVANADVEDLKAIPTLKSETIIHNIQQAASQRIDPTDAIAHSARQAYREYTSDTADSKDDADDDDSDAGFEANAYHANEVSTPAGPPKASGEDFNGLPVLEPQPDHPFTIDIDDVTPIYTRELDTGEQDVEAVSRLSAKNNYTPNLVGYAGVGKDTIAKYIAARINQPVLSINMDGSMLTEDLLGIHHLEGPNGEEIDDDAAEEMLDNDSVDDVTIVWKDGPVTRCVRFGWMLVISEINAAPPKILMALHQLFERDPTLHIKESNEVIEPHPFFRMITTMNPPEQGFNGTSELNDAFRNRLISLEIDYLPPDKEVKLLDSMINTDRVILTKQQLKDIVQMANRFRDRASAGEQVPRVSPRDLMKIADMADGPGNLRDAAVEIIRGICGPRHQTEASIELAKDQIDTSYGNSTPTAPSGSTTAD